jgi:hypothetical protein
MARPSVGVEFHHVVGFTLVESVPTSATGFTAAFAAVGSHTGGGGGAVDSVNGQTGAVVLDYTDVGAAAAAAPAAAVATHVALSDPHGQYQREAEKGVAGGYADLDGTGKVPASELPAFVDDVVEYANLAAFPVTGESSKIYVALDTSLTYRWSGSTYVAIGSSLALGETSATAYRGDRGKTAYDHSQLTSGNPHSVTKANVGLGSADNTPDTAKPVSTAQQTAIDGKVSDTAYDATTWNGVTSIAPSKNAVRDKIEAIVAGIGTGVSWADVTEYGATGDGITDDTTAINAAITAAGTNGTVYWPAATDAYLCKPTSSAVKPSTGQTWFGDGQTSVIRFVDGGATQYGIDGSSSTGVTFRNLVIDGGLNSSSGAGGSTTTALDFSSSTGFRLEGCEVRNAVCAVVDTASSHKVAVNIASSTGARIVLSHIHDIGWHPGDLWKNYADTHGTGIRAAGATDFKIIGNEIDHCVSDAVFLGYASPDYSTDGEVVGNQIHDQMYAGINCFISDATAAGIDGVRIDHNEIKRTNGIERGNRPGKRTATVVTPVGGSAPQATWDVTLSGPVVGHPKTDRCRMWDPATGNLRGDTYPGNTNSVATQTWTNGVGGAPAGSTMVLSDTTPTIRVTFPAATTLAVGDQFGVTETGESSFGIYTKGGIDRSSIIVAYNTIEDCNEPGIEINRHSATCHANIVRNTGAYSWSTASDRPGIYGVSGCVITDNIIDRPWGNGIEIEDDNELGGHPGIADLVITGNTIIDGNFGATFGSTGVRTGWGPRHLKNSIATSAIDIVADLGDVSNCIIAGNAISSADATYPFDYHVRLRVADTFVDDGTNLIEGNVPLDAAKVASIRYHLNGTPTPVLSTGIRAVTGATSATSHDRLLVCTGGAYAVTLMTAALAAHVPLTIRNANTSGIITVTRASSDTIDGANTVQVIPGGSVTLASDFVSKWYTTADAANAAQFTVSTRTTDYASPSVGQWVNFDCTSFALTCTLPDSATGGKNGGALADGDEFAVQLVATDSTPHQLTVAPDSGQSLDFANGAGTLKTGMVGRAWIFRWDAANSTWRRHNASPTDFPRTNKLTDAATVTMDTSAELNYLTSLSQATAFAAPTGTKQEGQRLVLRIKATSARALDFTTATVFRSISTSWPLPTTTTGSSATDLVIFQYNAADSKWDVIGGTYITAGGGSSSPLTTKGDVWGYSTVDARVPVGSNDQVLTADSAQALGVKWATPAAGGVTSVDGNTGAVTAAQLLTSIKTVDGSGSGLDADLLDGSSSAAFAAASHTHAESDITSLTADLALKAPLASPTFTGTVTVPSGAVLATPTSINLSNGTALPISTGVSGLGTGVATFLATPSSANIAAACTDETGSGALVFGTSPSLTTPNLGVPSAVDLTNATNIPDSAAVKVIARQNYK